MFKPMLSGRLESDSDLEKLQYPVFVSPKLDGIRATVQDGILVSRNLKPIRNRYTQDRFGDQALEHLDGELISGDPTAPDVYRKTNSAVMSEDGEPREVRYHIFDIFDEAPFENRLQMALSKFSGSAGVILVPHALVGDAAQLLRFEEMMIGKGFEGIMIRSRFGKYKQGRSTFREGHLIKVKRFLDSEAVILEVQEEMENANEATRQLTGKLKRSNHKENMIPKGRAGTLFVRDIKTNVEFNVAGFTDEDKHFFWENRNIVPGRIIKYKYFPVGVKDKPRHPGFLGFREDI